MAHEEVEHLRKKVEHLRERLRKAERTAESEQEASRSFSRANVTLHGNLLRARAHLRHEEQKRKDLEHEVYLLKDPAGHYLTPVEQRSESQKHQREEQ